MFLYPLANGLVQLSNRMIWIAEGRFAQFFFLPTSTRIFFYRGITSMDNAFLKIRYLDEQKRLHKTKTKDLSFHNTSLHLDKAMGNMNVVDLYHRLRYRKQNPSTFKERRVISKKYREFQYKNILIQSDIYFSMVINQLFFESKAWEKLHHLLTCIDKYYLNEGMDEFDDVFEYMKYMVESGKPVHIMNLNVAVFQNDDPDWQKPFGKKVTDDKVILFAESFQHILDCWEKECKQNAKEKPQKNSESEHKD